MEYFTPEITAGIVNAAAVIVFMVIYFKIYTKSQDKIREAYEKNIEKRVEKTSELFNSLQCARMSNTLTQVAEQLRSFIEFTHTIVGDLKKENDKQGGEIKDLFYYKNKLQDDFLDFQKDYYKNQNLSVDKTISKKKPIDCLLVEDDELARDIMEIELKNNLGYNVTKAGSVAEALKMLENKTFDCAILDYELGEHTAIDFINECKARNKLLKPANGCGQQVKALIYTGHDNVRIPIGYPSTGKPPNWKNIQVLMDSVIT